MTKTFLSSSWLKWAYLAVGVIILAIVAVTTDVGASLTIAKRVGWGFLVILLIYSVEFIADVMSWQMTFETVPARPKWTWRLWRIKMIGEAFNMSLPLGQFGGEPIKAMLLNARMGVGYGEAIASLVLGRTVVTMSLIPFLALGFVAALGEPQISAGQRLAAGIGLGAFVVAIALLFLIQRLRLTSNAARLLLTRRLRERIATLLGTVHRFEERLNHFYTRRPPAFLASLVFAFANWVIGAGTIWATFYYLGHPVSFLEAWVVEAFAQLVRASTFFVPASIGAQESAFVLVTTAITGNPALGLAVAIVRRGREIVWALAGLGIGWQMEALKLPARVPAAEPGD